jgi:hypothetical protein
MFALRRTYVYLAAELLSASEKGLCSLKMAINTLAPEFSFKF